VLASTDTDALLRERGFNGGFLELVRPFGEVVAGRVTVRDSIGASRTWEDFGVRFVGIRESLGRSQIPGSDRPSFESRSSEANGSILSRPSYDGRTVGGDVSEIEEVVDRHLNFAELRPSHTDEELFSPAEQHSEGANTELPTQTISPFYTLYLRRLLSGLPLSPHETFSHPVACIIAISSRNPSPIEEFKRLYNSTNTGDNRFPLWVNNEYLRYYVLVHDEDRDDIAKSTSLYEQMKRYFGLHCHLLRLRSTQCVPTDDDSIRLPAVEWMAAAEELAAIQKRGKLKVWLSQEIETKRSIETSEDLEDPTPCLFEPDATALKTFVRELVTQSIVPGMERLCAQWNEQVVSRRKGISGRFMSLTKRWTPFGGTGRNASSPVPGLAGGTSSSNYDSLQGFYRPDAPEALMRKLADYAFMLRDFKLASSTYDLLRSDFEHDKAWKYYAGANEMCLISTLLNSNSRTRQESIERWLEAATHSYIHRCEAPFYALRAFLLSAECLQIRGSLGVDEPATWAARILDTNLSGGIGIALVQERIAGFFAQKKAAGALGVGGRRRKRGFWNLIAAETWVTLGKSVQAEKCLDEAKLAFDIGSSLEDPSQTWMASFIQELQENIVAARLEAMGLDSPSAEVMEENPIVDEEVSEQLDFRAHRRSLIPEGLGGLPAGETAALSPVRTREADPVADEGFE
jgi:trafficking protein particle complex subunit 8